MAASFRIQRSFAPKGATKLITREARFFTFQDEMWSDQVLSLIQAAEDGPWDTASRELLKAYRLKLPANPDHGAIVALGPSGAYALNRERIPYFLKRRPSQWTFHEEYEEEPFAEGTNFLAVRPS